MSSTTGAVPLYPDAKAGLNLLIVLKASGAEESPDFALRADTALRILALVLSYTGKRALDQNRPEIAFDGKVWQEAFNHIPLLHPVGSRTEAEKREQATLDREALSQLVTGIMLGGAMPVESGDVSTYAEQQAGAVLASLNTIQTCTVHAARVRHSATSTSIASVTAVLAVDRQKDRRGPVTVAVQTGLMRLDITRLKDPSFAGRLDFITKADPEGVTASDKFIAIDIENGNGQ